MSESRQRKKHRGSSVTCNWCSSHLEFGKVNVDEESIKEQNGHKVYMHVDMCVHL